MHSFIKTYVVKHDSSKIEKEKIFLYFLKYNFSIRKSAENQLTFIKKSNLFEGWKMNPLNWSSEINIIIKENEIKMKYIVAGVYVTPVAFTELYDTFIINFKNFVIDNSTFKLDNEIAVKKAKKQLLNYYVVLIVGITTGLILSKFINDFLNSRTFQFLILYLTFRLIETIFNLYLNKKFIKNNVQVI